MPFFFYWTKESRTRFHPSPNITPHTYFKNQCCSWSILKHNLNPKLLNFTFLRRLTFFLSISSSCKGRNTKQSRIRTYCFLAFSLTIKKESRRTCEHEEEAKEHVKRVRKKIYSLFWFYFNRKKSNVDIIFLLTLMEHGAKMEEESP